MRYHELEIVISLDGRGRGASRSPPVERRATRRTSVTRAPHDSRRRTRSLARFVGHRLIESTWYSLKTICRLSLSMKRRIGSHDEVSNGSVVRAECCSKWRAATLFSEGTDSRVVARGRIVSPSGGTRRRRASRILCQCRGNSRSSRIAQKENPRRPCCARAGHEFN